MTCAAALRPRLAVVLATLAAGAAHAQAPAAPAPEGQGPAANGPAAPPPPAAAPGSAPQAHPVRFKASVDKAKVSLGETFHLTLEVVHAAADAYALPDPLPLAPLTLRGAPETRREPAPEGARTVFIVPLADVSSLTPAVPDLTLAVQGPEGKRAFTVPGQPLKLESLVAAEGAPSPDRAHHGPKPPVPVRVRSFLWAGLLVGLALAAAAAVLAVRFLRRGPAALPVAAVADPDAEALGRLSALRRREPWKRGDGRGAIFELSETVRHYLGRRLSFAALDLTSEELLRELRRRGLPGLRLVELEEEMAWEDLVKFAKQEPSPADCLGAIDRAETLVRETTPRSPASPAAPAREARA
ncbi:MAG: hypothetical protein NVS2B9_12990 [Myxococcales bacterium]